MANLKSSKKDARRIARRTERNRRAKTQLKTLRKKASTASADESADARNRLMSALDRAVKTNLIHRNKANRMKSRMVAAASVAAE